METILLSSFSSNFSQHFQSQVFLRCHDIKDNQGYFSLGLSRICAIGRQEKRDQMQSSRCIFLWNHLLYFWIHLWEERNVGNMVKNKMDHNHTIYHSPSKTDELNLLVTALACTQLQQKGCIALWFVSWLLRCLQLIYYPLNDSRLLGAEIEDIQLKLSQAGSCLYDHMTRMQSANFAPLLTSIINLLEVWKSSYSSSSVTDVSSSLTDSSSLVYLLSISSSLILAHIFWDENNPNLIDGVIRHDESIVGSNSCISKFILWHLLLKNMVEYIAFQLDHCRGIAISKTQNLHDWVKGMGNLE